MHQIVFLILGICCIAHEICLCEGCLPICQPTNCKFSDGYITGDGAYQKSVGKTDTEEDCAIMLKDLEPAAIGATWLSTADLPEHMDPLGLIDISWMKNTCYAEFGGEIRTDPIEDYLRSCIFQDYEHCSRSCVNGNNIVKYTGKSVSSCKDLCSARPDCFAFEYGVSYDGSGPYEPKDCQLKSSSDKTGCDGSYYNLDLYIRDSIQYSKVLAYWDYGSCGPMGDDSNWAWCNGRSGGPCQNEVTTSQCTSGIAVLAAVNGDQYATKFSANYVLDDCNYAYYAIYTCKEYSVSENKYCIDVKVTTTKTPIEQKDYGTVYRIETKRTLQQPSKLADPQTDLPSATAMCKLDPDCDQFYLSGSGSGYWKCNNNALNWDSSTGSTLYILSA